MVLTLRKKKHEMPASLIKNCPSLNEYRLQDLDRKLLFAVITVYVNNLASLRHTKRAILITVCCSFYLIKYLLKHCPAG